MSSPISSSFLPSTLLSFSASTMIVPQSFMDAAAVSNTAATTTPFVVTSAMLKQHNLQALVELQYVRVGNEVMNSALTKLDNALTLTQGALNQLANLQNLHSQISVTANSTFPLNFTSTLQFVTLTSKNTLLNITQSYQYKVHDQKSFVSAYQKLASVYYGVPIAPFFHVSIPASPGYPGGTPAHGAFSVNIVTGKEHAYSIYVDMLKSAKASLTSLIANLTKITDPKDPNTLLSKLKPILANYPDLTSFKAVQTWALDNYGGNTAASISVAGQFQQQIATAITAAQSTNTTQQEAVRRYMFVFEQYCQSAAAILKALDSLFDKISRNISGG